MVVLLCCCRQALGVARGRPLLLARTDRCRPRGRGHLLHHGHQPLRLCVLQMPPCRGFRTEVKDHLRDIYPVLYAHIEQFGSSEQNISALTANIII